MGSTHASEYANLADEGLISLEMAVRIHLTSNHFPPVPTEMVEPCLEAIQLASDGDYDSLVALPDCVSWRGQNEAPVWALVEGHHLESFLSA